MIGATITPTGTLASASTFTARNLTRLTPTDLEACISHLADPDIATTTVGIPHPFGPEDFAQRLARDAAMEAEFGHPLYAAIRQSNGWLIGMLAFQDDGLLELGYWLAKPLWGQGVMTVAVRAACHHAFFVWDVDVILASCFVSNVASRRVLEKNGFVYEGRHQLVKDSEPIDSWMYVLEAPPF
jgi:RimJ/RimL family protein N-acetyltransferase